MSGVINRTFYKCPCHTPYHNSEAQWAVRDEPFNVVGRLGEEEALSIRLDDERRSRVDG